jgi:glucose/arabinose dehydrogenase
VAVTLVVAATVACGDPATRTDGALAATAVVTGLDRPTQFVDLGDGSFLVAQLAGDEGAGTGQVVLASDGSPLQVLLDGLDVPTGVAVTPGRLWVMEATALSVADWDGAGAPVGPLRRVVDGLVGNGRSQGTLTVAPDGRVLWAVTGGDGAPGSGTLRATDPESGRTEVIATGAKNAYATAFDGDRLGIAEIGDAAVPPPDLLVEVAAPTAGAAPVDLGWPECRPVPECPGVVEPLAEFAPGATPTGVAALAGGWAVALFAEGRIVRVADGGGVPEPVASGLDGPHSVVRSADGRLLVSEHGAGRIVVVPDGATRSDQRSASSPPKTSG